MRVALIGLVVVILLALAIQASINERREWEAFKVAHHCKVTQQVPASTSVGYSFAKEGGPVMVTTPAKIGWTCDDGVTYWKAQ